MPLEACNRLADNWRPLFAVAQTVGGHWPERTLAAFNAFRTAEAQATVGAEAALLRDIRQILAGVNGDRLSSQELVAALRALPEGRWMRAARNGPITAAWLARQLGALGVCPRTLRLGDRLAKGYRLADLETDQARLVHLSASDSKQRNA